jgi:hypothetical protein
MIEPFDTDLDPGRYVGFNLAAAFSSLYILLKSDFDFLKLFGRCIPSMQCRGLLIVLLCVAPAAAFYLPGVAPRIFKDDEAVNMKVQTLISTEKPLQYDYYQLPFCKPEKVCIFLILL